MRRVTMATRDELVVAVRGRYANSGRGEKTRILDEFVAVTGFHRKHAMRVLRGEQTTRGAPRPARRLYDEAVRDALIVIWEASDRICGKRLKPLVPLLVEAMERHKHLQLAPDIRARLLAMSAATIDRALRTVREHAGGRSRRRAAPSLAVRRRVRCAPSRIGTIRHRVLWRQTWSHTVAHQRAAASYRHWFSLTSPRAGPNVHLCWSGSRTCSAKY